MRLGPAPEVEEEPGQFWKDFIRETAPVFRTPTIEQLETFIEPTWRALCDGSRYVDDRLREIFAELARTRSWRTTSSASLRFTTPGGRGRGSSRATRSRSRTGASRRCSPATRPPTGAVGTRSGRVPPRDRRSARGVLGVLRRGGRAAAARGEFIHESAWLNLYVYPAEADYARSAPLAPSGTASTPVSARATRRSSCRTRSPGDGALVYLSLGSLGSADVELMKRLVDVSPGRRTGSSSRRARSTPSSTCTETCGARSSCHSRRSCRSSTSSSPTAGTTRPPSASISASRWSRCRSSGISTTTRSASPRRVRVRLHDLRLRGGRAPRRHRPAARRRRSTSEHVWTPNRSTRAGCTRHREGRRPDRADRS